MPINTTWGSMFSHGSRVIRNPPPEGLFARDGPYHLPVRDSLWRNRATGFACRPTGK